MIMNHFIFDDFLKSLYLWAVVFKNIEKMNGVRKTLSGQKIVPVNRPSKRSSFEDFFPQK